MPGGAAAGRREGRADWRELAAAAGRSLRGGRRPGLGMQSAGPPALAASAPVTVGTRNPRRTPRGVGRRLQGLLLAGWAALRRPRSRSGKGAGFLRGWGPGFGEGAWGRDASSPARVGAAFQPLRPPPPRGLGRVHPVSCRPAIFAFGSLSKSSPRAPRTGYGGTSSQERRARALRRRGRVLLPKAVRREVLAPRLQRAPGGLRALPPAGVRTALLGPSQSPFPVPNR